VGPQSPPELVEAVRRAGARVGSVADASAMIWYGGSPSTFRELVHPGIRWVQLPNAGIESWIEAGVITDDRVFTAAAGCYSATVAEHTLALLLAAARRLHELARARCWSTPVPVTLDGATVTIVGAGGIGRALITMLAPLGSRILAVTRSGRSVPGADLSVDPSDLPAVLSQADYVVLAAPTTSRTKALIGPAELAAMKPTGWLVNVGRGGLVDTDALVTALKAGRIGGAALDVTDPEPLPDGHALWTEPRAIITPHSANPEPLLLAALAKRVAENIERFLRGQALIGAVDLEIGY
jgi:phosphoglycerate dehydrogenase-like enzyme